MRIFKFGFLPLIISKLNHDSKLLFLIMQCEKVLKTKLKKMIFYCKNNDFKIKIFLRRLPLGIYEGH